MAGQLGLREVQPDQSALLHWRNITIDTGAAQSTLQDIKVPEYGGGYAFSPVCPATRNQYLFWRVCHDLVELWEESLDQDFISNHVQLRFADTPVLEGLSVHETRQHVFILLATVSSVHRFRLPHPQAFQQGNKGRPQSILSDLTFQSLKDCHHLHILNSSATGEGLPHTASTHLVPGEGMAVFVLGQAEGTLTVVRMSDPPLGVTSHTIKNTSIVNRFFTGFVPGMFRGGVEGCETVSSMVVGEVAAGEVVAIGVCRDARVRAWCCSRLQCVLHHDALENTAEAGRRLTPGAQRHQVRKAGDGGNTLVAVFLTFAEKHLLLLYRPNMVQGQLSLTHLKTLYPPQYDLVDMSLTHTHFWTLWTDSSNETQLLYAAVESGEESQQEPPGLCSVVLEPLPEKEVPITDPFLDLREVYLRELFVPNRFSAHTLRKALGIYRRSIDLASLGDRGMARLQEEVEMALRDEVEARVSSALSEEEVMQVTHEVWATFYSHTLQYHLVGQKPVGVVGGVGVVRKQVVSWVRPVDVVEVMAMLPLEEVRMGALADVVGEDSAAGLVSLVRPLRLLHQALPPEQEAAFSLDLYHLQPPDCLAEALASSLLAHDAALSAALSRHLASLPGIVSALWAYLHALQLDLGLPDALAQGDSGACSSGAVSGLLAGRSGAAVVGAVVGQVAHVRFQLCRDLLVLQQAALQLPQSCLPVDAAATIRSTLLPKTALLTQAYMALLHLATAPSERPTQATLETARRQLAVLTFGSSPSLPTQARPATVLELFYLGNGGDESRALAWPALEQVWSMSPDWATLVMPLAITLAQLAWPISRCLLLLEWMVWAGQHSAVQQYVRLLQPWCEWNSFSRKFLLGVSLLNQGEAAKAAQLLIEAMEGVVSEDFLGMQVAGGASDTPSDQLRITYCLRVVRLLEQAGQPALALQAAQQGVAMAGPQEPALAALYSVVFKHELDLHHHDEAFTALLACPDAQRRRDCLRQLVVALHDRRCLETLIGYQYGGLEGEVVTILENRARSADILLNNYYHILYAFHVSKHNYKKAASVMYECALRLNVEGVREKGVRQQGKCYLACLNCLQHIPQQEAWIVRPLTAQFSEDTSSFPSKGEGVSPKRSSEGDPVAPPMPRCRPQVKVLELTHIQREYELVHARLLLLKALPDVPLSGGPLNPADTISLLTHAKLFREAVQLARLFEQSVEPILKGLAHTCLNSPIVQPPTLEDTSREGDERTVWWKMLKQLIEQEEKGSQSVLHYAVASALLQHSTLLPAWLVTSYKTRNCGELLRLYVTHGLLEEAVRLAVQYLDGVLGQGTRQVGLSTALHAAAPPVWLPYTALDKLLLELGEVQHNQYYRKLRDDLMRKLDLYKQELVQVSHNRVVLLQA